MNQDQKIVLQLDSKWLPKELQNRHNPSNGGKALGELEVSNTVFHLSGVPPSLDAVSILMNGIYFGQEKQTQRILFQLIF